MGGQTLRGTIGLLTIPFLLRSLGIREYGVWSLAYALLAILTTSEAGVSVTAAVFLSKDLAEDDFHETSRTLTVVFVGAGLLAVALTLFSWFVGPLLVHPLTTFGVRERAEAGQALRIAGFGAAAWILERTLVGVEQAFDRYGAINGFDSAQALLTNVGFVVVAWLGGRTIALMKWQVFTYALLLASHGVFILRLLRGRRLWFEWSGDKTKRILKFSVATWVSVLGTAAFGQCDRFIVGWILGAPVLGIYAAITNITSRINSFSGTAVQPLVPSLSHAVRSNSAIENRVREAVRLNALIAFETGIVLYVLSDSIMRVMAPGVSSPEYVFGLQIAAVIYALYSINAPGYFILFSVGEAHKNAVVVLCSGFASLVLIFVGARYFGLIGAIVGNVGYFGTLFTIVLGLKEAGIVARHYFAWIAFPLLGLSIALLVGLAQGRYFFGRVIFVVLEAFLLAVWLLRDHSGTRWREVGFGKPRAAEATINNN
jgi:O-antigen/teichoic acid export membrane protein